MINYDNFNEYYKAAINQGSDIEKAITSKSIDRWRHLRMLSNIVPFICQDSTWLTIGDGRGGTEARYLQEHGADAHATDLSDELLKVAHNAGLIKSYSVQNAESLSFNDNSFDYVLIKEALHHLPRPWIGVYEALRVCKKAVIIIEPNDKRPNLLPADTILRSLKNSIKNILKRGTIQPLDRYQFEEVGNFVFSTNHVELEKLLLAMHYRSISYYYINDLYSPKLALLPTINSLGEESKQLKKLKTYLSYLDILCCMGIWRSTLITAALYKQTPSEELIEQLKQSGWKHKALPKNPYL